ncbi:Uncharacterised protein [Candidatus Anstonella stagnisolia]|nr:Uncharacterised protein [Candidatus Anstonella stagnisolia]
MDKAAKEKVYAGGMGTGSIEPKSGYDYEMGGAPKKEKSNSTGISATCGKNVTVVRGGKKIPAVVEPFSKKFRLESGDCVETGDASYVFSIMDVPKGDDPCTTIMMFPNSRVEISTRHSSGGGIEGGTDVITKVKFLEGMISFSGPCEFELGAKLPVKLTRMSFGTAMAFCSEIRKDGSVAFFNTVAEIEHARAKVKAVLFAKETVATPDALYCLPALEERYVQAQKAIGLLGKSQGSVLGKSMQSMPGLSEAGVRAQMQGAMDENVAQMKRELAENKYLPKNVAEEYRKSIAQMEGKKAPAPARDEGKRESAIKAGVAKMITDGDAARSELASLRLPSPAKPDAKYEVKEDKSERRVMGMDDYMRNAWAVSKKQNEAEAQFRDGKISKAELASRLKSLHEEAIAPMKKATEHMQNAGKEGKPLLAAASAKAKIGKTVQYGAISIMVREAEIGPEFNMIKCPAGSLFVAVGLRLENTKSASTAYIVPDEEIWLNFGAGEPVNPENYKFETALEKGKPAEGYVWYKVPQGAKKFSIMLGKKKMPKLPVDFGF